VLHPSHATKVKPTDPPGFDPSEGYTLNGLKRAVRQHVELNYQPASIVAHFTELGVPKDQVVKVLARYFGIVVMTGSS